MKKVLFLLLCLCCIPMLRAQFLLRDDALNFSIQFSCSKETMDIDTGKEDDSGIITDNYLCTTTDARAYSFICMRLPAEQNDKIRNTGDIKKLLKIMRKRTLNDPSQKFSAHKTELKGMQGQLSMSFKERNGKLSGRARILYSKAHSAIFILLHMAVRDEVQPGDWQSFLGGFSLGTPSDPR